METTPLKRKIVEENTNAKKVRFSEDSLLAEVSTVNVGSRKSPLALIQTRSIIAALKDATPHIDFPIETLNTLGDSILHLPLPKVGEKGLFTKDLEIALEQKRVDFLVHSLKDLPTKMPEGMAIGAIYKRDNPFDCVVFHPKHKGKTLADLPAGSIIGTSSLRRVSQLKRKYPRLVYQSVRGNLNTRLRKLEQESLFDAIILAKAGLDRMGWSDKVGQILERDILYAVSQGAMAVEVRADDKQTISMVGKLTDIETMLIVTAERAFMRKLDGGCSTPVGCCSNYKDGKLSLRGICLSTDGVDCVEEELSTDLKCHISPPEGVETTYIVTDVGLCIDKLYEEEYKKAVKLGDDLALKLIELGADEILKKVKQALPTVSQIQIPVRGETTNL